MNPWTAIGGGIGWFGGSLLIGPSGGAWGSLGGGLLGGFKDAARGMVLFSKLPPCANTRPYLLPSMQLGGSVGGGEIGGLATGSWDGALAGANVGMLLGGIGATVFNLLRPCFAAGTPIRTAEGSKPIEEIVAGDHVLSRDENDPEGPVLLKVVEETFVRTGRIWVMRIDGRDIRTTGEYPFYARGKGWTAVADLDTTDVQLSEDGRWLPIEALEDTGEYETVYNFRVADFRTYFVGGDGWKWSVWTHNTCEALRAALYAQYPNLPDRVIARAYNYAMARDWVRFRNYLYRHGIDSIDIGTRRAAYAAARNTVWADIHAVGDNFPNSPVPAGFNLVTRSGTVHITYNAAEHAAEYGAQATRLPSSRQQLQQAYLAELQEVVGQGAANAATNNALDGQLQMIQGWEIVVQPSPGAGLFPAVTHALRY